jgi:hypothetical protein
MNDTTDAKALVGALGAGNTISRSLGGCILILVRVRVEGAEMGSAWGLKS